MSFDSISFLLFFLFIVSVYCLLPQKFRWVLLLFASYAFYMAWNLPLAFLLFGVTAVSFLGGRFTERANTKGKKRAWLIVTLFLCLGVLFVFKYLDFSLRQISSFLQSFGKEGISSLNILLPMGISFYTFQALSYVIDVYRGTMRAEKHFGYYALYLSFFPQLVAGPIERPENLIPQLKAAKRPDYEQIREGARFLFAGYFKKIAIADFVAVFVNTAYGSIEDMSGVSLVVATVLFAVQIYCDFSGYSDIAVGCAKFLGVNLMQNFDRPYTAKSVREFWRRWHISLTSWFTDYLYIPLGGSRKGSVRRALNTLIVFFVSGLWHGAEWSFVVWGLLHGCFLVGESLIGGALNRLDPQGKREKSALYRGVCHLITLLFVWFAWIFFRAETLGDAFLVVQKIVTSFGSPSALAGELVLTAVDGLRIFVLLVLLCVLPRFPGVLVPKEELPLSSMEKQSFSTLVYSLFALAIALAWLIVWAGNGESGFIYFQF